MGQPSADSLRVLAKTRAGSCQSADDISGLLVSLVAGLPPTAGAKRS